MHAEGLVTTIIVVVALLLVASVSAVIAHRIRFPYTIGLVVVVAYNLPGLDGALTLSGPVIADLYLGRITRWNAPEIAALNPGLALPDRPVRVARRADSSGTTQIFTEYLSAVSPLWRDRAGAGKTVAWPTGDALAGEGSDGIAHQILLEPGGIGYVEVKYAQNSGLSYARLLNQAGRPVWPEPAAVQAAERNTPAGDGPIKRSVVNAPGADSYPIAAFTYMLVYRDLGYLPPDKANALVTFLAWCLTEGQAEAEKLHYVALPSGLQTHFLAEIEALRASIGPDGAARGTH